MFNLVGICVQGTFSVTMSSFYLLGLPEPPVNLRLEQQTLEKIILTWLPVTITPAGYSNGFKVSGYKVYVNGIYCTETDSSSVDSVSIPTERLCNLGKRHDFTRMRFVVRTLSVLGESADSNVVEIPSGETSYTNTSRPALEGLDSEENKTKTGTETAAADICETNPNATAQDESSARHTSNKVFSDLESDTTISDQLSAGSDLEKKHNQCRSVEGPRWSAAATDTEESTENELEIGQEDFIKKTCEQVYRTEPAGEYNSEKQHGEPGSAGEVGLRPATENTDKNRKVTEPEIGQGHISETRDVLPIDSRRKPVVVLYDIEDDETETESCTAESKTETEEEPVEIFVDPKVFTSERGFWCIVRFINCI